MKMIEKNIVVGEYVEEYAHETIKLYLYLFVGFLVPFTLGHPQALVGTVVNATLILSALEIKSTRYMIPLLFAPSLGVLARGLVFGPFTPFLAMMLPFIWVSNAILVFGIRELHKRQERDYWISLGISSLVKTGFLFSVAFVLVSLSLLPVMFLETMGVMQLITAIAGGIFAFSLVRVGITRLKI